MMHWQMHKKNKPILKEEVKGEKKYTVHIICTKDLIYAWGLSSKYNFVHITPTNAFYYIVHAIHVNINHLYTSKQISFTCRYLFLFANKP